MPSVERPDDVEIHWEERGTGPLVVLAHHTLWSYPGVYEDLVGDIARDHRVVVYDPRGCGQSTRRGPYDSETDAQDLSAVAGAAGGKAVALAIGDGFNRSVHVAAARPDLISHLIAIGPAAAAMLPRTELRGSGVLAASEGVVDMVLQMLQADPRTALRTVIATVNPELDESQLRDRVDRVASYIASETALDRMRSWFEDDVSEEARMLGDRLLILHGGTDPLFEGALGTRVAELYPQARIEELADGPVSRPDLSAAQVRRVTGAAATNR